MDGTVYKSLPAGVTVVEYDPLLAKQVFDFIDENDMAELRFMSGAATATELDAFLQWHQAQIFRLGSWVAVADRPQGPVPFAVLGLSHAGYPGTANAALLARAHRYYRRELVGLVSLVRDFLPKVADDYRLRRIEVRHWCDHPTAGRVLARCGFWRETGRLQGFGGEAMTGDVRQWSWIRQEKEEAEE